MTFDLKTGRRRRRRRVRVLVVVVVRDTGRAHYLSTGDVRAPTAGTTTSTTTTTTTITTTNESDLTCQCYTHIEKGVRGSGGGVKSTTPSIRSALPPELLLPQHH